jgi:DNA-binding NarL/FixJ family response regulator
VSGPIRVLVADDHPLVRTGLAAALAATPDIVVVAEADGGPGAIEAFRRHRPDVALVDLRMPGVDGIAVTRAIRQEFPAARVIILSSYDTDEDIHRAFAAGAVTYVLKETSPTEVVEIVRAVGRGESPIPAAIEESLAANERREPLSSREREILKLLAGGLSNRDIAARVGLTENTVRFHLKAIFAKLGVDDRTLAVVVALQRGIIRLD